MSEAGPSKRNDVPTSQDSATPAAKRVRMDVESTPADAAPPSTDPVGADSPSARGGGRGRSRGTGSNGRGRGRGGRGGTHDRRGGSARGNGGKSWGGGERQGRERVWGAKPKEEGEDDEKKERHPKKKVAVLVGYNGIGYSGSQINNAVATVEGEIFKALIKAGAISEDNSDNPSKVGFTRAARTDAGVHAAVNVLALKMIIAPPSMPEGTSIEDHINSFLPSTVRVWEILRVQGSFSPRSLCDQRQYEYTLPTHVFLGPKPTTPLGAWITKSRATAAESAATELAAEALAVSEKPEAKPESEPVPLSDSARAAEEFWKTVPVEGSSFQADLAAKRKWRIPAGLLGEARTFVKAYEGSHNYYNFTVGKDFRDRSCQRVMRQLDIGDPFIVNDVEYVSVSFLGQSFMLHQIRKMIGLAILAIRSCTPASLIAETFGPSRIHIPKAPGLGLLLLEPQYVEYNKRIESSNKRLTTLKADGKIEEDEWANGMKDPVKLDKAKDKVEEFKKVEIYNKMWEVEEKEAVFSKWLNYLDYLSGPDFEYLNPKGVIPASAVFKKGENTEQPRHQPAVPAPADEAAPPSDDEAVPEGDDEG